MHRLGIAFALSVAAATLTAQPANDIFTRIRSSNDVAWLERIASVPGAAEAETPSMYTPKSARSHAYVRLGALGSSEAIAAVRRVDSAARQWLLVEPTLALGRYPHPAGHFSDYSLRLLASVTDGANVTYGVLHGSFLAGEDVFLTTSRTPMDLASWSRPVLLPGVAPAQIRDVSLEWGDANQLVVHFTMPALDRPRDVRFYPPAPEGPQRWILNLADVQRDRDRDGWTDLEEARLRLNPTGADSDGDGIPDGRDVCPNYAASPAESRDQEVAILQKVFFAAYGIHGSRDVMMVESGSRPMQLWGSRGPVLYGVDRSDWGRTHGSAPPRLSWKLIGLTETDARVTLSDFESPLAAATYDVRLRKLDGEWFVVLYEMTSIS